MTREEAITEIFKKYNVPTSNPFFFEILKALEQEPCNDVTTFKEDVLDAISRIGLFKSGTKEVQAVAECLRAVEALPPVKPQEPKTGQFAKWVATEIFDDNWEYNKDAFAEIACRKLEKIGIVKANGDEWELVEPQERSE